LSAVLKARVETRPASSRPIDLAHLSRQTMGDRALEQEILRLFVRQASTAGDAIAKASGDDRKRLVHSLKGTARSIGAFDLGDCLAAFEKKPGSALLLRNISRHIAEACDFVAAITR